MDGLHYIHFLYIFKFLTVYTILEQSHNYNTDYAVSKTIAAIHIVFSHIDLNIKLAFIV